MDEILEPLLQHFFLASWIPLNECLEWNMFGCALADLTKHCNDTVLSATIGVAGLALYTQSTNDCPTAGLTCAAWTFDNEIFAKSVIQCWKWNNVIRSCLVQQFMAASTIAATPSRLGVNQTIMWFQDSEECRIGLTFCALGIRTKIAGSHEAWWHWWDVSVLLVNFFLSTTALWCFWCLDFNQ